MLKRTNRNANSQGCAATFVLPGRPQTYKPPRHRYGQKHFYCGHKKEIKIARRLLEAAWGDRDSLTDKAVRLDIWACCVKRCTLSDPRNTSRRESFVLTLPSTC